MKHLKNSQELDLQKTIDTIKKELLFDTYGYANEEELKEEFENLNTAWRNFVNNQEMGQCQDIVSAIKSLKLPNVEDCFGHILVDDPANAKFTHHWITINGTIFEFSKGTLKENIEWFDLYDVECEDANIYEALR